MRAIELTAAADERSCALAETLAHLHPRATHAQLSSGLAQVQVWDVHDLVGSYPAGELPHADAILADLGVGEQLRLTIPPGPGAQVVVRIAGRPVAGVVSAVADGTVTLDVDGVPLVVDHLDARVTFERR